MVVGHEYDMKSLFRRVLGDKFVEWNLDVASPSEALQAIAVQRQGLNNIHCGRGLIYEIVFMIKNSKT